MARKRAAEAVSGNNAKKIRKLVNVAASNVDGRDKAGLISGELWEAVKSGQLEVAASLVRSGVDLSICKDGGTILHEVLRRCKIKNNVETGKLVRLMLDHGADVNAVCLEDFSVLRTAMKNKNCSYELVSELLDRGAQVTIHKDEIRNDIFWATSHKSELLPRLVEHLVPDKEARNLRGAMAISFLITYKRFNLTKSNSLKIFKKILDLGVPVNTVDPLAKYARSLLSVAVWYRKPDMIKLLLDYGADPSQTNELGQTALYHATVIDSHQTSTTRYLIERGASIHARNEDGECPIYGACVYDSPKNVHLFLSLGADINVPNNEGSTPFGYVMLRDTSDTNAALQIERLFIKHLALIVASAGEVHRNDIDKINQCDRSKHYLEKCNQELEKMKEEMIYRKVSYFSLLARNMKSMIQLMKNKNFVKKFKQDKKKQTNLFPIYSSMLLDSVEVAKKRLETLLEEKKQLQQTIGVFIPEHIVELIAYEYSYDKLLQCKRAYYLSMHAKLKNREAGWAKIL